MNDERTVLCTKENKIKYLALPYKNSTVQFVIVLPDEVEKNPLLNVDLSIVTRMKDHAYEETVDIYIPKFKFGTKVDLE